MKTNVIANNGYIQRTFCCPTNSVHSRLFHISRAFNKKAWRFNQVETIKALNKFGGLAIHQASI
jgi:hypothetical protein